MNETRLGAAARRRTSVGLALAFAFGMPVEAATFTVTNNNSGGAGSLNQAILDANAAGPGAHTVNFSPGLAPITILSPPVLGPGVSLDLSGVTLEIFSIPPGTIDFSNGAGVSGSGALTVSNSTTLLLGSSNSYTGATSLTTGGTLNGHIDNDAPLTLIAGNFEMSAASRVGSLNGFGNVKLLNGNLTVGGDDTSTSFGGNISSVGPGTGLEKIGAGTLTLTGNLTYTGPTIIQGGTLQIGDATRITTLPFVSSITNDGALVIDTTKGSFTYNGAPIGGTGSVTVSGPNLAALGFGNTYTGPTTVNGGMLNAQITNDAALTIAGGATYQMSFASSVGSLSGAGNVHLINDSLTVGSNDASTTFSGNISEDLGANAGLVKTGAGALTLTGAGTYTGPTTVNAGTLQVNGSLTSAAVVNNGASLMGSGTLGGVDVQTGGILAPGNSIGTLTINGDATFQAGSIYRVEADDAGNSDRLDVTGTATINGGTVDVQATGAAFAPSTQYTIVNAAGGVTGTFSNVTSNLAFLTPSLSYDANNVFLTLASNGVSYCDVARTRNQSSICGVLENAALGATGDLLNATNTLNSLSAEQARAAFSAIAGASIVQLRRASELFTSGFGDMLNRRLGAVASTDASRASGPILLAATDRPSDIGMTGYGSPAARHGFWMRAQGVLQDIDGDGNAAGSDLSGGALSVGADTRTNNDWVVGLSFSAGKTNLEFDGIDDDGYSRGRAIGVYAGYASGPWTYRTFASYAWHDNHMDRDVVVGGLNSTARSDFDSHSILLHGEASVDLPMGGWTLQPLLGVQMLHTRSDGFTEKGTGALNLDVGAESTTSVRTLIGAKTIHDVGGLRMEPRLAWSHEFGDINEAASARLVGATTAGSFQVYGVDLKRDTLLLGLGLSGEVRKRVSVFGDVQMNYNSRQRGAVALAGVRAAW